MHHCSSAHKHTSIFSLFLTCPIFSSFLIPIDADKQHQLIVLQAMIWMSVYLYTCQWNEDYPGMGERVAVTEQAVLLVRVRTNLLHLSILFFLLPGFSLALQCPTSHVNGYWPIIVEHLNERIEKVSSLILKLGSLCRNGPGLATPSPKATSFVGIK